MRDGRCYRWLILGLLLAVAGMVASGQPARGRTVSVALLSGRRTPEFESYLNDMLQPEMFNAGIGALAFKEIGDYDALLRSSEYGKYEFFKGSPLTFVTANARGGYHALLKSTYHDQAEYTSVIIVNRKSGIHTLSDLIGKRVLCLNHHSASGFLYPYLYLLSQGISPAMFAAPPFDVEHIKTHRDLVAAVNAGTWDAGCTFQSAVKQYPAEQLSVLAVVPRQIPADLLYVDAKFARENPDFTQRFSEEYAKWINTHPLHADAAYTLAPARDADYDDIRRQYLLAASYATLEAWVANAAPERLKDMGSVRLLFRLAQAWTWLWSGRAVLALLLLLLGVLLVGRRSPAVQAWYCWLRLRAGARPAPPAASHQVFISYASADHQAAEVATAAIERRGIRCWMAPRDVPAGAEYAEAIMQAIGECRLFVMIFSARANHSEHVHREVGRAVDHALPLLVFRLENAPPSGALEYYLSDLQWLDAFPAPFAAQVDKLAETVENQLAARVSPPLSETHS